MGAGASRYKSVEDAVGCGIPHTDIDNYLAQDCEAELASINRCFGQDVHLPSSATACGRACRGGSSADEEALLISTISFLSAATAAILSLTAERNLGAPCDLDLSLSLDMRSSAL